MKIFKKTVLPLLCAAILGMPFVSCGGDDDDEPDVPGSDTVTNRLEVITASGMTMFTFSYDGSGRMTRLKSSELDMDIKISYSPMKIEFDEDGDVLTFSNIKLNSHGFITEATCTDSEGSYKINLTYNDSGNLTSISDSDGETSALSWAYGRLMKATSDGEVTTYTYTELANPAGMFSPLWDPLGPYWMTGLFGTAPNMFPASITNYDGETAKFAYKLNNDGTIAAEQLTYDGSTMTLSYRYSSSRAAAFSDNSGNATVVTPRFKSPFRRSLK